MSAIVTNKAIKKESNLPITWKPSSESYSCNEVIEAYEAGKKEGQSIEQRLKFEKLEENLAKSTSLAEGFFELLIEKKCKPTEATMRINSITSFDVAFIVSDKAFFSDEFRALYREAHKIREANRSQTYNIYFTFIPKTKFMNEDMLVHDGFTYSYYGKEERKPKSNPRKA